MSIKSTSKRIARRGAHLLGLLVLVAIIVPFVIYAVPGAVGADHSFVVLSGSMEPTASAGDAIIVESVDPTEIESGDVIAFQKSQQGVPTTHRVVTVLESDAGLEFLTQGDANLDPDPGAVAQAQVIGRVMSVEGHLLVIPYIGHVILFIATPLGFASLIVLPIALLVLSEMWSIVRSTRMDRKQSLTAVGDERPAGNVSTAVASGGDHGATEAPEVSPTSGEGIRISRSELTLALPVLAAFSAYSIWIVTRLFTSISITVAMGSGLSLLFAVLLYVGADWSGDTPRSAETGGDRDLSANAPSKSATPPAVEVDSIEHLLGTSRASGAPVTWDPDRRRYRTLGGPVSFVFDGNPSALQSLEDDVVAEDLPEPNLWAAFADTTARPGQMTTDGGTGRER